MAQHEDPNARMHRPFLVDGEYPAPVEPYPGAGYKEDGLVREQAERLDKLQREGGALGGQHVEYPDRGLARGPIEYEQEMKLAAELRACHGGLPDGSPENPAIAVSSTPFKNMKTGR